MTITADRPCPACHAENPPVLRLHHIGGPQVSYCRLCGCGFIDARQQSDNERIVGASPLPESHL